jgi:hypothetical protein
VPEVCELQIRQLRSDLPQQLQVTADTTALGDAEHMLDRDGMTVVELEHHATAERPEQRGVGRHAASVGADEGASAAAAARDYAYVIRTPKLFHTRARKQLGADVSDAAQ